MNFRTTGAALFAVTASLGCQKPDAAPTAPNATATVAAPTAAPTPTTSNGRAITEAARAVMKKELSVASGRKAWIYSQPGNPEVAAVVTALQTVLQESGWEVGAETATGISLKPGVVTLVGEELIPTHVTAVLKALDASGLAAKSASGYRSYFQDMKSKNPNWPGVPLRPEQEFIIVIGPMPPA